MGIHGKKMELDYTWALQTISNFPAGMDVFPNNHMLAQLVSVRVACAVLQKQILVRGPFPNDVPSLGGRDGGVKTL